jgi:short-subunit dehydrogenase
LYADLCIYEYNKFIKITSVYPGFINTRSDLEKFLDDTSDLIPRVEPEYAAEKVVRAIVTNKQEIFFPFFYRFAAFFE